MPRARYNWPVILNRAAAIVRSYDSGVTLRQLFYRLVSEEVLPNTRSAYNLLSSHTAQARRDGWFPALVDRGRAIQRLRSYNDPADALRQLAQGYHLDRTAGQKVSIYLGVEKNGLINLLWNWFGAMGISIVALGGYSSQTFVDDIAQDVDRQGRPAVLIYAGDFDPSGEDISRDFISRSDCWARRFRIALNPEQVDRYNLPRLPGKETDSRAKGFIRKHGELVQVELDALPPDVLRGLYAAAIRRYWNPKAYDAVIEQENADRKVLESLAKRAGKMRAKAIEKKLQPKKGGTA